MTETFIFFMSREKPTLFGERWGEFGLIRTSPSLRYLIRPEYLPPGKSERNRIVK